MPDPLPTIPGAGVDPVVPNPVSLEAPTPSYIVGVNLEYQPSQAVPGGTTVVDVGSGIELATPEECAAACTAAQGCTAASWYGANAEWVPAANCYLKTFGSECEVPPESVATADVFLLVQRPQACALSSPLHLPAASSRAALAVPPESLTTKRFDLETRNCRAQTFSQHTPTCWPGSGTRVAYNDRIFDQRTLTCRPGSATRVRRGAAAGGRERHRRRKQHSGL